MPSDNFKEDICLKILNYNNEKIWLKDTTGNDNENSKPTNIDNQNLITSNYITQNGLLNILSQSFRNVTFKKSEFLVGISILDTKYIHPRSQSSNLFYLFNDQLYYTLACYFAETETTKRNINKSLSNLFIILITKTFFYYNIDK